MYIRKDALYVWIAATQNAVKREVTMLFFPEAKINIGLNVVRKRPDGYHDIESLFMPVPNLHDILEVRFSDRFEVDILNAEYDDTLCTAAYSTLKEDFDIPPLKINLYKNIPAGAGLGGGSSDAATTIMAINQLCSLGLGEEQMANYAARIGSDCPFFIYGQPMMATGRGEILKSFPLSLDEYRITIHPQPMFVSTREAYSGVTPKIPETGLDELLKMPVEQWKGKVVNDFEESVFACHPSLAQAKEKLYEEGALYVSMSGSGSSLFEIRKTSV